MKAKTFLASILFLTASASFAAVVEEIYAVVNDEVITATELAKFEMEMARSLQTELTGEKLEQALAEMRGNLLDRFIEQKLLLSKVKEKNYDVEADVETIIQEIKKQNSIPSDEELKAALAREGIEFSAWKEMWRERRRQERLIGEEVGSKIKIDNPQIMEYYRTHADEFTVPAEFTLNGIYLKRNDDGSKPQEKMDLISARLSPGAAELKPDLFVEVAKQYSELPDAASDVALGRFKAGEMDKALEEAARKLKRGEHSGWIEIDNGWYIIQLAEFSPEHVREMKDAREEIIMTLREAEQQVKVKDYLAQLKKESYIKIVKKYP